VNRYPFSWLVASAAVAIALAGALWWVGSGERFAGRQPVLPTTSPSAFAAVQVDAPPKSMRAVDVLHDWDRARARAYASRDLGALRALYVAGSSAGTADVAILRSYLRRGLRVEGMRMQLIGLEVLRPGPGRLRLRVTDRLHGAVAVDASGTRVPLPRDQASTRIITLRRVADSWRVAAVAPTPPR
jgi:hypothetical protein